MSEVWDKRKSAGFVILIVGIIVLVLASIALGAVNIPIKDVVKSIFNQPIEEEAFASIIWKIRMPRTLAALLCGSALAIAGLILQVLFKNPLVDTYILGVASGSSMAVALLILAGIGLGFGVDTPILLMVFSFLGAMGVMAIVLMISKKIKSTISLLVVGLMMGYVANAVTQVLIAFAEEQAIGGYMVWTMGSYAGMTWTQILWMAAILVPSSLYCFMLGKKLNIMLLGEKYAQSMGLNIKGIRKQIIVISSLLAAAVTAFAGPVSFIGLAVPHMTRLVFKTSDNRILIPANFLSGAFLSLFCDFISRMIIAPAELPLGSVTAMIGAPIVIYLVMRRRSLV